MAQMLLRLYAVMVLCFANRGLLYGQVITRLNFKPLTISDGLSQGFISCITQDKKGFIWVATSDGLNKYDGYAFTTYHHDPQDGYSLAEDDLAYVFEDSKERLWIATRRGGLDLFDREHLRFYHIIPPRLNSNNRSNRYRIVEEKPGVLYFSTPSSIIRLQSTAGAGGQPSFHLTYISTGFFMRKSAVVHPPKLFAHGGRLLITTRNEAYGMEYDAMRRQHTFNRWFYDKAATGTEPLDVLMDTSGRQWLLCSSSGIFRTTGYGKPVERLYTLKTAGSVWSLDHTGALWLGNGSQLERIRPGGVKREHIAIIGDQIINDLRYCVSIYTDRNGVVWFGTSGYGILKYDPSRERFHAALPGQSIYRIYATGGNRIAVQNNLQLSLTPHGADDSGNPYVPVFPKEAGPANLAGYTCYDTKGTFWFCRKAMIVSYNPATGATKQYKLPFAIENTSAATPYADSSGAIWLNHYEELYRFHPRSGSIEVYDRRHHPDFGDIQAIREDKDGVFWLGTRSGLFRFNAGDKTWKHWQHKKGDTTTINNDVVLSLCNDPTSPKQYLWAGTPAGLNRFDKTTGKATSYTTKNGLPNNMIYGILSDAQGRLWLSTNKGLAQMDRATGAIRTFGAEDGLQSDEFNRHAYCKTERGLLVFGGVNGINYFNPADISALEPPRVVLTGFKLFNKSVDFRQPHMPLRKDISFTPSITLRHSQDMFTIQFAAMDYRRSGRVRYRYRLAGFDAAWIDAGTGREATYTNLDPGTYRFAVAGSNSNDTWGVASTLSVRITPPWWRTWWFYTIASATILALTYALYRYRLNQLLRLERMRNRIARDLHDEVGTSLSTISIYTKLVQKMLGSTTKAEPLLKKITENANQIQDSMSDIVWSINTRHDKLESLANRMREHAVELLEPKGYLLHFHLHEALRTLKLDMERRKDFYLIYKEALNNIAKYADGHNGGSALKQRPAPCCFL